MELPKDYPLAVAVALAMNIHCYTTSLGVSAFRKKIFNPQFMNKEFGFLHKSELGEEIKSGGYPDAGNGVYSQKLSYKDWYQFNILQRVHMNYIQNIHLATGATLAAGIYQPRSAAYVGLGFLIGRFIYSIFYKKNGGAWNKGRIIGAVLCMVSILGNVGIFFKSFYRNYSR